MHEDLGSSRYIVPVNAPLKAAAPERDETSIRHFLLNFHLRDGKSLLVHWV
jgi:hypothetical protein